MHRSRRVFAASVSVSIALGAGVAVAHADASSVLYVNNSASANCTDTGGGAGSSATPFCTIQAAANAAVAGDDVDIYAGTYDGAVDITSSGTATAPITFQLAGNGVVEIDDGVGQIGPALTVDEASYVDFDGSLLSGTTSPYRAPDTFIASVLVNGSSNITLNGIDPASTEADYSVQVTGTSSDVSLTRSILSGPNSGVLVEPGSFGDVISTNEITDDASGIEVDGASNTAVTSNTLWGQSSNDDQINVSDSTGTSIENNIVTYPGTVAGSGAAISIDTNSATSTTEDYNVVWPDQQGTSTVLDSAYSWAGADYSSQASFNAVTGQGAHDLVADPLLQPDQDEPFTVSAAAPQLNSANYSAPGMLMADLYHAPCQADAEVAITGAGTQQYCERGAVHQEISTTLADSVTPDGALGVEVSSSISAKFNAEGGLFNVSSSPAPAVSYIVDWGDGTTSAPIPGSATGGDTTTTHTYAKPGSYKITDIVDLPSGSAFDNTSWFTTAPLSTVYALGPGDASVQEWMGPATGWKSIGGPASALYVGGAGVFAATPSGSAIYQYDDASGTWSQVGGSGAQFVVSADSGDWLYALAPNRSYVAQWNGSGTGWTVVGGPAQAIYPAVDGVFATSPGNTAIYEYTPDSWTKVGGAGAQFATNGDTLYGLGPNDAYVSEWNGSKWTVVGGPASRIYAGGAGLFAVNPGNTAIYQYDSSTNTWTKVGGGGAAFAVSQTSLFGQSSAGGPVLEYSGIPGSWTNIGGSPTSIVGG